MHARGGILLDSVESADQTTGPDLLSRLEQLLRLRTVKRTALGNRRALRLRARTTPPTRGHDCPRQADTQNDALTNGLALSKNAHRMFDEGLWFADDHLRILTAAHRFTENGPEDIKLAALAGRPLQFAPAARLHSAREFLRRHRQRHGFRG